MYGKIEFFKKLILDYYAMQIQLISYTLQRERGKYIWFQEE